MSSVKYIYQKNVMEDEEYLSASNGPGEVTENRWKRDKPIVVICMVIITIISVLALILSIIVLSYAGSMKKESSNSYANPQAQTSEYKDNMTQNLQTVRQMLDTVNTRLSQMEYNDEQEKKNLTAMVSEITNRVAQSDSSLQNAKDVINDLQTNITSLSAASKIGFSIGMSVRFVPLNRNEILPFDKEISNYGSHFDLGTHKFTCPIDGVYYFTVSVNYDMSGRYDGEVSLVIDNTRIFDILSYKPATSGITREQGSNSVVKKCTTGQKVWVKSDNDDAKLQAWSETHHTVFAGFLLFKI